MRVCPKCGFVDPPEWKHSKYSYWIDNCTLSDFSKMKPEMVNDLMKGAIVEDPYYLYRLTKNKHRVERKAKVDYGNQWTIPMERATPKHNVRDFRPNWYRVTPNQKKLLETDGTVTVST